MSGGRVHIKVAPVSIAGDRHFSAAIAPIMHEISPVRAKTGGFCLAGLCQIGTTATFDRESGFHVKPR
jgi:hypothetical protein